MHYVKRVTQFQFLDFDFDFDVLYHLVYVFHKVIFSFIIGDW